MLNTLKAIETTGTVNKKQIVLDAPFPVPDIHHARIIVLLNQEPDINEQQWLKSAAHNPVFDFLKEPEEDIYNLTDGKPFHD